MAQAAQPQLCPLHLQPPRPISKSTAIQSYLAFPPKPTRKSNRKNYLRPKLPIPPTHPSPIPPPTPSREIPTARDLFRRVEDAFRQETRKDGAPDDGERAFDAQTTAISSPSALGSGNSFVGIGFHWYGLIVVQTVLAVWLFGFSNVDEKSEGGNAAAGGSPPSAVDRSGGGEIGNAGVSLHEPEFEKKVSEIRVMAREARALEQKKSGNVGADSSSFVGARDEGDAGQDGLSSIKSDIRKGVDYWLMKLQKSLYWQREKSSKSSNSNARDGDWAFGRQVRPGISSTKARNDPKCFMESKPRPRSENGEAASYQEQEMDSADDNYGEEESHWLRDEVLERVVLKVRDNALAGRDPFVGFGTEDDLNFFRALDRKFKREGENAKLWMEEKLEGMDLGIDGPVEPHKVIQSSARGKFSGTTTKLNERSKSTNVMRTGSSSENFQKDHFPQESSSRNGSFHKAENDQLDVEKNSWWLKLPYVFAILLHRVGDRESPKGLYSLKTIPHSDDESSVACTVTFEDRRDANNFCHVLESFFEDLGDLRAEALPLSINEMKEALKSSSLKALVVRKGQLQLYAGQPLEDVEMALRSMVEQDELQTTKRRS